MTALHDTQRYTVKINLRTAEQVNTLISARELYRGLIISLSETFAFAAEMSEGTITDLYVPKK